MDIHHLEHPRLTDPRPGLTLEDARRKLAHHKAEADLAMECFLEMRKRDPEGRDPDRDSHIELCEAALRFTLATIDANQMELVVDIKLELIQRNRRQADRAKRAARMAS